jgi:hypothetical protein
MPRGSAAGDPAPGGSRPLPDRPNLRYLKLEAKRRLAASEFPALHDAQVAIAWEHGLPSWTALKQRICAQSAPDCQVLPQLSWLITRFRDADQGGWTAPAEQELQQHFAPEFLAALPAPELVATISGVAPVLREELAVVTQALLTAQVQLGGLDIFASVAADPPHKLTGLMAVPTGRQVTDPRMSAPRPARLTGTVPAGVTQIADESAAELACRPDPGGGPDAAVAGHQGLGRRGPGRAARPRAPLVPTGSKALVTRPYCAWSPAAARHPGERPIRTVRLEDATITVRALTHTAGVTVPPRPSSSPTTCPTWSA